MSGYRPMDIPHHIHAFARESNRIEGINDMGADGRHAEALAALLEPAEIDTGHVIAFLEAVQPDAKIRWKTGMNVRVGDHVAPPGGPDILPALNALVKGANQPLFSDEVFTRHRAFQTLHPFTDGNGLTGRALWLRDMGGRAPLGFLQTFYYQALRNGDSA